MTPLGHHDFQQPQLLSCSWLVIANIRARLEITALISLVRVSMRRSLVMIAKPARETMGIQMSSGVAASLTGEGANAVRAVERCPSSPGRSRHPLPG